MNSEKSTSGDADFASNKTKLMNEIDYIDILVSALNSEADDLINQIDNIDKIISTANKLKAENN